MLPALLLLTLLSPDAPTASSAVLAGDWIGVLDYRDGGGQHLVPTTLTLTVSPDGKIDGTWKSRTKIPVTGAVTGQVDDKGKMKLSVTLSGSGVIDDRIVGMERCSAEGDLDASLTTTNVLRLTANVIQSATARNYARGRACDNLTRVVWTLQRP